MTVFTEPVDLVAAIVERVNPGFVKAPDMGEILRDLAQPGRVIGFRTQSGSLYEATIYTARITVDGRTGHRVALHKIVDDKPVLTAEGIARAAHDPRRDVYGLVVNEASGRYVQTSAVTQAWLAYDALA